MSRLSIRLGIGLTLLAGALSPAVSQGLVIREGERVRLTWSPPGTTPDWLQGTVSENSTGPSLIILPTGADLPTTVRLDASTRLQLYEGRRSSWRLGAFVGGLVGAAVGATVLSSDFGRAGSGTSAFERSQAAIVYGAVGGALGGLITHLATGRPRWSRIPLDNGRVQMPNLTIPWRDDFQSVTSPQRWTAFTPSDLDFTAFFQRHADSLLPIEGVWDVPGGDRFAVIRDQRFMEYEFVAIRVTRAFATDERLMLGRDPGPIYAALRFGADGRWEVRILGNRFPLAGQLLQAELDGPVLSVSLGGETIDRWLRVFP